MAKVQRDPTGSYQKSETPKSKKTAVPLTLLAPGARSARGQNGSIAPAIAHRLLDRDPPLGRSLVVEGRRSGTCGAVNSPTLHGRRPGLMKSFRLVLRRPEEGPTSRFQDHPGAFRAGYGSARGEAMMP